MRLYILASGKDEKGSQLEKITKAILEHFKYEYVNTNIVGSGGDEIDVTAKHVLPIPGGESIYRVICECKAHEKPITIDDWDKFLGKIFKNDSNGLVIGLMIALSDANGNVKGDIEEHREKYLNKIRLVTGKDMIDSLADAYGLDNINVAKEEVRLLTNDTVTSVDIILHNEEIYWLFSFANDTFSIFDKKYNSINSQKETVILSLLSEKTNFSKQQYRNIREEFDIIVRRNALKMVSSWKLMHGSCSFCDLIDAVARFTQANIVPNEKDVLEGLAALNFVIVDAVEKTVKLREECDMDYVSFYKTLFTGDAPFYLYNDYYKDHIDNALLDRICIIQYGLKLTQTERDKCLFLLKSSPSALCYALNSDPLLRNAGIGYDNVAQSLKNHFIETLLFCFENDCNTKINGFVFGKLGVRDFQRTITVKVVDNSGTETTISAQKRLFYMSIKDKSEGSIVMALDNFDGKYNKETDTVEPTSFNTNNRYEPIGNHINII